MKILPVLVSGFWVCVLAVSCSSPTTSTTPKTTPPGNNPNVFPFTVAASVDSNAYSAGATMTITDLDPNYMVVV